MSEAVNAKSAAVLAMGESWQMLETLMAGTAAMRTAGKTYLPKWPLESDAAWNARKSVATLFPAYRRTVSVMSGKPFAKALTYSDDVPEQIKEWCEDVDLEGVNLHTFASEMFPEAFYGLAGILVEAPQPIATAGRVPTVAEQQAAGVRPYMVRIYHGQILGWRSEMVGGVRKLTMLRLCDDQTAPNGAFGEKRVERVRVLTPGAWTVWEKAENPGVDGKPVWVKHSEGKTSLPYIPYAPVYGARRGFMMGAPPLLDLAYLNVKHWQSQSDQDTILNVARVPILALSGGNETTSLTLGGSAAVMLPEGAELKFVEHTGAAIEAGQVSLEALEAQMIQAGAELLVKKPGSRTATETANDAEGNKSDLQRMVEGFEDSLDLALQFMADYGGLPTGGHVSLFKDFGASTLAAASGQLIVSMKEAGIISHETTINELKRRGELAADVEAEDELEKIAEELAGPDSEDGMAAALGMSRKPADQQDPADPEIDA